MTDPTSHATPTPTVTPDAAQRAADRALYAGAGPYFNTADHWRIRRVAERLPVYLDALDAAEARERELVARVERAEAQAVGARTDAAKFYELLQQAEADATALRGRLRGALHILGLLAEGEGTVQHP